MKDYYKILELKFGAKDDEIKKSYRYLAQTNHPDKHFGDKTFEELFKEINEAYSILGDISKKSDYDHRYQNYFFKQSSSYTNNTNSSAGNNTNTNKEKEQNNANTKTNNKQSHNMNKESVTDKIKFYNNKFFIYAFLILVVGIGFLIYKWKDVSAYYDEKDRKEKYTQLVNSIQETKQFNESAITALRIPRVTLETRWKDDLMYYKVYLYSKSNVTDNTYKNDSLKTDTYFETRVKTISKISINFLDKDGFKIYTLDISISDMTRIVDGNGNVINYTINSNIPIKPELYKDFQSWELTYTTY